MTVNIKRLLYGLMLIILSVFIFSGSANATHQRSGDGSPDHELPNNGGYTDSLNRGGYPDLVVGKGAYEAPNSRAYIYVKQNVSEFNLQIVNACNGYGSGEDIGIGRADTRFFLYNVNSISKYNNQSGVSTGETTWAKTAQCNSGGHAYLTVNMDGARKAGSNSVTITNSNGTKTTYTRATIDASVVGYGGSGDYENSFYYHVASPKSDVKIVYVNEDSLDGQENVDSMTGIYNRDPSRDNGKGSDSSYWGTNITFGPSCSADQVGIIRTFDNDTDGYQSNREIEYYVYHRPRDLSSGWTLAPHSRVHYDHPPANNAWREGRSGHLRGGDNVPGTRVRINMSKDRIYRVMFRHIYWRNSIQLTIPANPLRALDTCVQPTNWDYDDTGAPTLSSSPYRAGSNINVTGEVQNIDAGAGPEYEQRIRYSTDGGSSWSRLGSRDEGNSSIPGNSKSNNPITRIYSILNTVDHNKQICFDLWFDPTGPDQSTPTLRTGGGSDNSPDRCINVYNQRFRLDIPDIEIPGLYTSNSTSQTANFRVHNRGDVPGDNDKNGGPSPTSGVTVKALDPEGADGRINIISVNGNDGSSAQLSRINWESSTNVPVVFEVKDTSGLNPGDEVCVLLRVTPRLGFSDGSSTSGSDTGEACQTVGEQAYLEVHNGSVWAGAGWAATGVIGGSSCGNATADNFIRTHTDRPNRGSYAEYAATANASINGFDTDGLSSNTSPNSYFTFANTPSLGSYDQNNKCVTDYYEYLRKSGEGVTARNNNDIELPSGQYFNDSTLTIGGLNKTINNQVVYVVDGDVRINTDVLYSNYSANNSSQIPFLMIVASGDIIIHNQVQELNGVFISKAKINTCHITSALTLFRCNNQLTVKGMFIAEDIEFRRTFGGILRQGGPAEVFRFSPEVYLANPNFISDYEDNFSTAQTKELPPLYR